MVGRSSYRPRPLGAFVFLFLVSPPASSQPTPEARAAAIRRFVERNRHYSLHCLCWAYTDETLKAVRKKRVLTRERALWTRRCLALTLP
jgi:hypothetical protein